MGILPPIFATAFFATARPNTRTAPTNNSNRASGPGPANVITTLTFEPRALTIRTEPAHFIFFKRVCTKD